MSITKQEALNKLNESTHMFYPQSLANEIAEPFGFQPQYVTMHENLRDPKGLRFDNPDVKAMKGISSWVLAMQICDHLGIKYEGSLGRGSQQRICTDAIAKHLNGGGCDVV